MMGILAELDLFYIPLLKATKFTFNDSDAIAVAGIADLL